MRTFLFLSTLVLFSTAALANQETETVVRSGTITEDTYLVGERVRVDADVDGDVVVAAGEVDVSGSVSGDVMAAGGQISITAILGDDVRAAGGQISLCTTVAGDAVLAGGDINICKEAIIRNKAWVAGGDVTIDGRVEQQLTVKGGQIRLAGKFLKDVSLEAGSIEVLAGTEILGNLNYKSPNPAKIHDGAKIVGEENYSISKSWWSNTEGDWTRGKIVSIGLGLFFLGVISVLLTALILSWLLPNTFTSTKKIIRDQPLPSIAAGLIATLVVPVVLILLLITIIGIPLAGIGLLFYLLLIVLGWYAALLFIADTLHQLVRGDQPATKAFKLLSTFAAILIVMILAVIPLIGSVILFLAYLTGVGALCLHIIERKKGVPLEQ